MNGFWTGLGRGEQLLLAGAALIFVFADILVGLVTGFTVDTAIVICAVIAIAAIYLRHTSPGTAWPFAYEVLLLVLTIIVVVFALDDLIASIHTGFFQNEQALDVLSVLAVWVGAALMAIGWWLDWGGRPKA